MTEQEFDSAVVDLAARKMRGGVDSLDCGRLYRELCEEYLRDHEELPDGYA